MFSIVIVQAENVLQQRGKISWVRVGRSRRFELIGSN
jgi:hypothetical protein